MYAISPACLNIIKEGSLVTEWEGTITFPNGTTKQITHGNIDGGSGAISLSCSPAQVVGIGNAYLGEFVANLVGTDISPNKLKGAVINLNTTIWSTKKLINTWEQALDYQWSELLPLTWGDLKNAKPTKFTFPMGRFVVEEAMKTADAIKITCYDFMHKFDVLLPSSMPSDAKIPYDWLMTICSACGVTLGTTRAETFKKPNGMRKLAFSNASENMKTWRDALAEISQAMGANAMMDRSGRLVLRWYSKYQVDGISASFRYTSQFSDYKSYYTGIFLSYRDGGIRDYVTNADRPADDTGLVYDLAYNAFLQISDEDARQRAMKEIIDAQKGLSYTPFKIALPFNPAYDLMDVLEFYENQASHSDKAPITAMTFRIGGKMDISCGGENPALQEAQTKESKALEGVGGNSYDNDFWMVMDNAPEDNPVEILANDTTKVSEALFYAKEELSMIQVAFTATYNLLRTTLVEVEVFVDEESIYHTKENQWPGENRLTVTTGYELEGIGSHKVEVYLTVKESSLDIGGGGVLMRLNITENSEYDAQNDYGVYGFSKVVAAVPDDIGYYGGAQKMNVETEEKTSTYIDAQEYASNTEQISYDSISEFYCRISENIGDGAVYQGRGFTRTTDSPPLLFINVQSWTGYNSYGVLSNHSEIPAHTGDYYGSLYSFGTLTVDGNTFYIFCMGGFWPSSREGAYYTVDGNTFNFPGDACYIHLNNVDDVITGNIVAMSPAFENDCRNVLARFAQMG